MRFVSEFRDKGKALGLIKEIEKVADKGVNLMEVCGTHTVSIFKHGIKDMLPKEVNLLSGPGCPVCVTPTADIERAIYLARLPEVILVTFGDMMRVPGRSGSLEQTRAEGQDIRVVYSSLDAITIAQNNPGKKVIFFGIGFETTSPSIACTLIEADKKGIDNFYILSCHKLIPPAMKALLELGEANIQGFICPGHVSTIIGAKPYEFIPSIYHIPCVIAGFEPLDILQSILMLLKQLKDKNEKVEIQYTRSVRPEGNQKALDLLDEVFERTDSEWRGIGVIPNSGLRIKEGYRRFDAETFGIQIEEGEEYTSCICGNILRGIAIPYDCPSFAKDCTPLDPIGPCMVSTEGACAAYYKYGKKGIVSFQSKTKRERQNG